MTDRPPLLAGGHDPGLNFVAARLGDLTAYWDAKRGGRRMPGMGEIDPVEMAKHLGRLCLIDVSREPMRFRWRLMGSSVVDTLRLDATGDYLDEADGPAAFESIAESCRWVVRERAPLRSVGTLPHAGFGRIGYESVELPLSGDGENVDRILSQLIFGHGA